MNLRSVFSFLAGLAGMLALGWLVFPAVLYQRTPQPAQFSHKVHTGEAGMSCSDCHAFREDGSFAGIPRLETCLPCHTEPAGETPEEKHFIEAFVKPNREVPWLVYSRQPDNVRFSHARHVKVGKMACEDCHGPVGESERLKDFQQNGISGYSRDIWGPRMLRTGWKPGEGMKMSDCEDCHRQRSVVAGCLGCHK